MKQQNNKIAQLIDHSAEVKVNEGVWSGLHALGVLTTRPLSASPFSPQNLEAVVSQLKRLLQHAETEAKTLWQELRLQEPKVDTTPIQERILLRQQVKLRTRCPCVDLSRPCSSNQTTIRVVG